MIAYLRERIEKTPGWMILYAGMLIAVTTLLIVIAGNMADHVRSIEAFDKVIYEAIQFSPHPNWLNTVVAPFNFNFLPWGGTFIPSFLYFVIGIGLLYILIFNRKNIGWALLALVLAIIIDAILFKITNAYVVRDRPFVHLLNTMPEASKAIWLNWPTYPSGHVRDAALYSVVLSGYAKKLIWPFIILTLWVGYTRIYLGAHYPSDVVAGLVLGYVVGISILVISKSLQQLNENQKVAEEHPNE